MENLVRIKKDILYTAMIEHRSISSADAFVKKLCTSLRLNLII